MSIRKVSERAQTITQNTTLMPEGYGGWYCKNVGNGNVEVNGFVLGEGEDLDFMAIEPDTLYSAFTHTHPTVPQRVKAIREILKKLE